jgi:hypothetical protein
MKTPGSVADEKSGIFHRRGMQFLPLLTQLAMSSCDRFNLNATERLACPHEGCDASLATLICKGSSMGASCGIEAARVVLQDQQFKKFSCKKPSCVSLSG